MGSRAVSARQIFLRYRHVPADYRYCMPMKADIELNIGAKTFASGLLVELIAALRRARSGDLMAVIGSDRTVDTELEAWCRFTRNSLVDVTVKEGRHRWVIRCGEAPENADAERPVGSRL